jgi:hypothetical protein
MTTQFGSLQNLLAGTPSTVVPEVGMGATQICWTDRRAFTVIWVSKSGKTIRVQEDIVKRFDFNGVSESQNYEFARNPDGAIVTLRMTKKGWAHKGQKFIIGVRSEYYDYSF